jgi:hypothetical protein
MDDGVAKFLLVSTDLCLFSPTVYDEVARRIEKETVMTRDFELGLKALSATGGRYFLTMDHAPPLTVQDKFTV